MRARRSIEQCLRTWSFEGAGGDRKLGVAHKRKALQYRAETPSWNVRRLRPRVIDDGVDPNPIRGCDVSSDARHFYFGGF